MKEQAPFFVLFKLQMYSIQFEDIKHVSRLLAIRCKFLWLYLITKVVEHSCLFKVTAPVTSCCTFFFSYTLMNTDYEMSNFLVELLVEELNGQFMLSGLEITSL